MGSRTYLFTGGGTGGHVTPAIALANELRGRQPDAELVWVGTREGKEAEIVPKYGIPVVFVSAHQFTFRRPWDPVRFVAKLSRGILTCMWLLLRKRPAAVIGTGGYVAAPLVFANIILRRIGLSRARTVIHEQNITPGKLNAVVGRFADLMLISFSATRRYFPRAVYVGYPVRREIHPVDRDEAKARLGIPGDTQVVFAVGGSMGARTINRALIEALPVLSKRPNLKIIHATGRRLTAYDPVADCRERLQAVGLSSASVSGWYESHEFIDDMAAYYGAADVVVARGGAGTVAELCAAGRPSLIIPKSNLAGDHQVMNALELVAAGAANILYEDVRTENGTTEEFVPGHELAECLIDMLDNPVRLDAMGGKASVLATPDAVYVSIDVIERLVRREPIDSVAAGTPEPHSRTRKYADLAMLNGEALREKAAAIVEAISRDLAAPSSDRRAREEALVQALASDDICRYLRYRAVSMLGSDAWRIRNAGVKMIGILRVREKLPVLLSLFNDRTPARHLQRLLGGDFVQNGFIRRNTIDAVAVLGVYNEDVRHAIINGLQDPYFEVRSHTAHAAAELSDLIGSDTEIEALLRSRAEEKSFEVVLAAARALGRLATGESSIDLLHRLLLHDNWKVREAALGAFGVVLEAKPELVDRERLRGDIDEMMMTSTGFVPTFALKTTINRLGERIAR